MWDIIQKYLKEKNMTVYELAKKAGVRRQGIYALRDGRAENLSLKNAFKLADALEVDVNVFRERE
ncbi:MULTISPECIES: helix-turn-helix transcriptional regulator [unclassified Facklamia]|uniref:helix-turn-helix domain-containing protein n=1 Tax=Aerococcaceae TaxID=186827 RepID=UPI0013B65D08|nr:MULTISPECIES: helix-turn-helix transcriptional regulator [unclassified Facklamia]NEW64285.1 helix-turn-helix domain-containing protein [Facklamia sp. 252]NEW67878.1 helix-turn-helix domain-containing protein [Facklamia sp. 253]QQD64751.1 helix-turn-helix transcriptional regulator [Aerococcaceae bacterium zg-252]